MAQQARVPNWKLPFFTIWTGQAFSLLGSKIAQFALIWWMTEQTGSATVLATASLVGLIPDIVLGPLTGAYVDRLNRRVVMLVADTVVALASLWLALLFWAGTIQLWHVYAILFVRSVGGGFHWTAMQASTSLMVPKEQLTRVAGMNQTLHGLLNIFGAPAGALLMELLPLHGVMLVDVGTAALAIGPLFFVPIPQPAREGAAQAGAGKQSIWADLRDGVRYLVRWPGLVVLTIAAMAVKVVLTPAFSLLPLLVKDHFGGNAAQLGLLEAVMGGGIVGGGLILSVWGGFGKRVYTMALGITVFSFAFLAWGVLPGTWFWAAVASGAFVGLAIPLIDGPIMAILQSTVAPELQGRVFTLFSSLIWITSPLGLSLAGPISDWLGLQVWYLLASVLGLAASSVFVLVPAVRNIEENANGNAERVESPGLAPVEA
jgi:DHA3 family macrolide efflux protein-like MFS transporter